MPCPQLLLFLYVRLIDGREIKGLDFDEKLAEPVILFLLMLFSLRILNLLFSPQDSKVFHTKHPINLIEEDGLWLILELYNLVVHVEFVDILRRLSLNE